MFVECTGVAKICIEETGEVLTVNPDELDWDSEGVGEGGMGMEVRHWAEVVLTSQMTNRDYTATWQVWEYPVGVEDNSETETSAGLKLLEDFTYYLAHEPDRDQE